MEFRYDVGISFLTADQEIARELHERLRDRVRTFFSPERQREIAGSDGEETFIRVFRDEARTVVVLFREGWGKSPWTAIEARAIRDRALKATNYEFVTFIVLEENPSLPDWLPRARLWLDLSRLGIEGATAVIQERVRVAGTAVPPETAFEKAERYRRRKEAEAARDYFLHSAEGVAAAEAEAKRLGELLFLQSQALSEHLDVHLGIYSAPAAAGATAYVVRAPGFSLSLGHSLVYEHSLEEATLAFTVWRGPAPFGPGVRMSAVEITTRQFAFDQTPDGDYVWRAKSEGQSSLSGQQIVDLALTLLVEQMDRG